MVSINQKYSKEEELENLQQGHGHPREGQPIGSDSTEELLFTSEEVPTERGQSHAVRCCCIWGLSTIRSSNYGCQNWTREQQKRVGWCNIMFVAGCAHTHVSKCVYLDLRLGGLVGGDRRWEANPFCFGLSTAPGQEEVQTCRAAGPTAVNHNLPDQSQEKTQTRHTPETEEDVSVSESPYQVFSCRTG